MNALLMGGLLFGLLLISVIIHELGHYLYFKVALKRNISIVFYFKSIMNFGFKAGYIDDYESLTDKEYVLVNIWGILLGFIPIIIAGMLLGNLFYLVSLPYIWGSQQDLFKVFDYICNIDWEE